MRHTDPLRFRRYFAACARMSGYGSIARARLDGRAFCYASTAKGVTF